MTAVKTVPRTVVQMTIEDVRFSPGTGEVPAHP